MIVADFNTTEEPLPIWETNIILSLLENIQLREPTLYLGEIVAKTSVHYLKAIIVGEFLPRETLLQIYT